MQKIVFLYNRYHKFRLSKGEEGANETVTVFDTLFKRNAPWLNPERCSALCMLGNFSCFPCRLLTFFFKINFFKKMCTTQTVRIQIRTDVLLILIWVQTVCKGYQQTTSLHEIAGNYDNYYIFATSSHCQYCNNHRNIFSDCILIYYMMLNMFATRKLAEKEQN